MQTICIVPHRARASDFFDSVYIDGLRVAHNDRLHSLLFSSVLSAADDAVSCVNDSIMQDVCIGHDVVLLVAVPVTERQGEDARQALQQGYHINDDDASLVSGLTDSGAVVLELYMHLFHTLFHVAEDEAEASLSITTCRAPDSANSELRDELRRRYVRHVNDAYKAPLHGSDRVEWGDVIRVLSQMYETKREDDWREAAQGSGEKRDGQGRRYDNNAAMACVVQMRLCSKPSKSSPSGLGGDGVIVTVIDVGGNAVLLQRLSDTLCPHKRQAASQRTGSAPAHHPLINLLQHYIRPSSLMRVIVIPDPYTAPSQSLRLLRLVSALETRRQEINTNLGGSSCSASRACKLSRGLLDTDTPSSSQRHGKSRSEHKAAGNDNKTLISEVLHGPTPSHLDGRADAYARNPAAHSALSDTRRDGCTPDNDKHNHSQWLTPRPSDFVVRQMLSDTNGRTQCNDMACNSTTRHVADDQSALQEQLQTLTHQYRNEHVARIAAEQRVILLQQAMQETLAGATVSTDDKHINETQSDSETGALSKQTSAAIQGIEIPSNPSRRSHVCAPAAKHRSYNQGDSVQHTSPDRRKEGNATPFESNTHATQDVVATLQLCNEELARHVVSERRARIDSIRTNPKPTPISEGQSESKRMPDGIHEASHIAMTEVEEVLRRPAEVIKHGTTCDAAGVSHVLDALIGGCASLRTRLHSLDTTAMQLAAGTNTIHDYGRALVALRRALVAIRARQAPALTSLAACAGIADVECIACILDFERYRCEQVSRFLPVFSQLAVGVEHLCLRAHALRSATAIDQ